MGLDSDPGVLQPSRMSRNQALHAAALALPEEERADLALDLIDSLDGTAEEGVEEAWADEVDARVTAWRAGQAEVVPFEAAVTAARERLKARHG
jgi:putative addiction module component (TIGR02574 family)